MGHIKHHVLLLAGGRGWTSSYTSQSCKLLHVLSIISYHGSNRTAMLSFRNNALWKGCVGRNLCMLNYISRRFWQITIIMQLLTLPHYHINSVCNDSFTAHLRFHEPWTVLCSPWALAHICIYMHLRIIMSKWIGQYIISSHNCIRETY